MLIKVIIVIFSIILLVLALPWFCYWILRKLGYPKVGEYVSIIVVFVFITIALMTIFEDHLFSKNDARELLKEQDITLTNEFEILKNESMIAPGDYYHTFTLKISEEDKKRIISKIKISKNFNLDTQKVVYSDNPDDYDNGPKSIKNYGMGNQFGRELFQPRGKGYAPIWRKIRIDAKENKLIFEDIDE